MPGRRIREDMHSACGFSPSWVLSAWPWRFCCESGRLGRRAMGWRQSGPRVRTLDFSAVRKGTGRGRRQNSRNAHNRQEAMVFGILGDIRVAVGAGSVVCEANKAKRLEQHL